MSAPAVIAPSGDSLPTLVQRAADALLGAKTSAEVLAARDMASMAYDTAKAQARIARAKAAHDDIIARVYRSQAEALAIEAEAKARLADEYDAAQERGEVAKRGEQDRVRDNVGNGNVIATAADLGIRRDQIHEARQVRDAEREDPGVYRRTALDLAEQGVETTKAAVKAHVRGTFGTGENEWYTPAEFVERARRTLGGFDLDPASSALAQERIQAAAFFDEQSKGLAQEWRGRVWMNPPYSKELIPQFMAKLREEYEAGRVSAAITLTHNYTDTRWFQDAACAASAICFPRGRIRFVSPTGEEASPTQGQAFCYFGDDVAAFVREFGSVGLVAVIQK